MTLTDTWSDWVNPVRRRLTAAVISGLAMSAAVLVSAAGHDSGLGAPLAWPWLLTGLQVLALWSAGSGRWWGWPLGAAVQLPWIAYATVTAQLGFIPGCAVSASIQFHSFVRANRPTVMVPAGAGITDRAGSRTLPMRTRR